MPTRIVCHAWLLAVTRPTGSAVEDTVVSAVEWLRLGIDVVGALVIGVGVLVAFGAYVLSELRVRPRPYEAIRLLLGRFLALGLEFQLAGDVLRTAIAHSFTEIGQLAAIATIRTALNYFLAREIANERAEIERQNEARDRRSRPASAP